MESQLEIEKTKSDNDSKKFQALINDFNREKEQLLKQQQQQQLLNQQQQQQQQNQQQQSQHSPMLREGSQETMSPSLNRFTTFFEARNELRSSFDLGTHTPSALNTLEMLQSRLKQREGEVGHLQVQNWIGKQSYYWNFRKFSD